MRVTQLLSQHISETEKSKVLFHHSFSPANNGIYIAFAVIVIVFIAIKLVQTKAEAAFLQHLRFYRVKRNRVNACHFVVICRKGVFLIDMSKKEKKEKKEEEKKETMCRGRRRWGCRRSYWKTQMRRRNRRKRGKKRRWR